MFENYIKSALRAIAKNKLYASINIIGLALGMSVFLFAWILTQYEQSHDTFFANHERIYTIGMRLAPGADVGIREFGTTYSAFGPIVADEMDEVAIAVRTHNPSFVVKVGDKNFHERIKFADQGFLTLFDFDYVSGNEQALDRPTGAMITVTTAEKWFGRTDVLGETVTIAGDYTVQISAVVQNPPGNTHFNSLLIGPGIDIVLPLSALEVIDGYDPLGIWDNISAGNHTYILTDKPIEDLAAFEARVNDVFMRHAPAEQIEGFIESIRIRKLPEVNNVLWDMAGMPIIDTIKLLGLLILVIAMVNYTNLATAQSMGRTREVGLRKTMGASRFQLMVQFLTESLSTAFFAMLITLVVLENLIPWFNHIADKVIAIDYLTLLPTLLLTAVATGLLAGAYPSYLITRSGTLDALKDANRSGQKGGIFRAVMIGTQFTLSIFMLALVLIVFYQNQMVKKNANVYPKEKVLVLGRLNSDDVFSKEDVLRRELKRIDNIEGVTFVSMPPFEQSNSTFGVSVEKGDEENRVSLHQLNVDHEFVDVLGIKLVAGRNFSANIASDRRENLDVRVQNVLISELATQRLGFSSAADAVGKPLWGMTPSDPALDNFEYRVVGVIEDQNYQGLHNKIKPWIIHITPRAKNSAMVRLSENAPASVMTNMEKAWQTVMPDYPLEYRFLDELFQDVYQLYQLMNGTLAGFAFLALMLALIGLFGLAAFMARGRTKEIGVRKVMGASVPQLVSLLLWQFSKPVLWAIAVALPLAMMASNLYLNFFAERIGFQIPIVILAGAIAVLLASAVIAMHAIRVAKNSPIHALRYE